MRIALFGGKQLLIRTIGLLQQFQEHTLLVVLCSDDVGSPADVFPSAKLYCARNKIPFVQPTQTNDASFVDLLKEWDVDVIVSMNYDRILGSELLKLPRFGAYNVHFGPLPKCRGLLPLVWSLWEYDWAGYTIHQMTEVLDGGPIFIQESISIGHLESAAEIYESLSDRAAHVLVGNLSRLVTHSPKLIAQDNSEASYHGKAYPLDRWVPIEMPIGRIYAFLRAHHFPPFPAARVKLCDGSELTIVPPAELYPGPRNNPEPRVWLSGDRVWIANESGCISCSMVEPV